MQIHGKNFTVAMQELTKNQLMHSFHKYYFTVAMLQSLILNLIISPDTHTPY